MKLPKTTENIHTNIFHFKNGCDSAIFLQPASKGEIANVMSSLNSNKAYGPNSMPYI